MLTLKQSGGRSTQSLCDPKKESEMVPFFLIFFNFFKMGWYLYKNKDKEKNFNMKRIVRLTESDLARIVKRVVRESETSMGMQSGKLTGKRFVIKDPRCGMDIMTVRMGKQGCESKTRDGLGCNTVLVVTELNNFPEYFINGPKNRCDMKLYRFLTGDREGRETPFKEKRAGEVMDTALKASQIELYFDCSNQQLYLRGKTIGIGVREKSFMIDSSELESFCLDNCDASN